MRVLTGVVMEFKWNESMSVNVKEIDDQHKHFVRIVNKFNDAIFNHQDFLEDILKELSDYANDHFATEEKYFKEFDYEGTEEHIQKHNKLKSDIAKYSEGIKNDRVATSVKMVDFLEGWMTDHFSQMDHKYTKCFNEHGLY